MKEHKALDSMIEQGFKNLREGQFEEAVETFSACHAIEPRDDRALRGRGLAYIQLKNALSAETDFKLAITLNSDEPENQMGFALTLAMQNKIYEAIGIYEELIHQNPGYILAYLQLGHLQLKIGTISKGREYFKKALTLRPTLEQRRLIESILKEQSKLDANRFYRPDFEQLRKQQPSTFNLWKFIRGL